jgi:hypothetical protein
MEENISDKWTSAVGGGLTQRGGSTGDSWRTLVRYNRYLLTLESTKLAEILLCSTVIEIEIEIEIELKLN